MTDHRAGQEHVPRLRFCRQRLPIVPERWGERGDRKRWWLGFEGGGEKQLAEGLIRVMSTKAFGREKLRLLVFEM